MWICSLVVNHETPMPGALVGPVSACITGTQFQHLKYGDRFFYTHEGQFTPGTIAILSLFYSTIVSRPRRSIEFDQ